jgi:hypothetical protein
MKLTYALAASCLYGACYMIYAWTAEKASFAYVTFWGSLMTALLTAPLALRENFDLRVTGAVLLERCVLMLASFLIYTSVRKIGVEVTSTVESTSPLFVLLFGMWVTQTRPPVHVVAGAILVVGGVVLIGWGQQGELPAP